MTFPVIGSQAQSAQGYRAARPREPPRWQASPHAGSTTTPNGVSGRNT